MNRRPLIVRSIHKCGSSSVKSVRRLTTVKVDRGSAPAESNELDLDGLTNRSFSYQDVLTQGPLKLLKAALEAFLPKESHNAYSRPNHFLLGHQYAYFRPDISDSMLCHDGTDTKFLPGPETIWKYRLWAGGSVHFSKTQPIYLATMPTVDLVERAVEVRVIAKEERAEKVFVNIERKFALLAEQMPMPKRKILLLDKEGVHPQLPFMTEIQKLCFLREPPASMQDERKIKPPTNPTFKHTMTPSSHLLFQFSALTHNAHRIHVDPEFARRDYGARNLLVHGPLTHVLMAEFLHRQIQSLPQNAKFHVLPRRMDYTNLQPLFVDEPLTLCCKPMSKQDNHEVGETKSWQVWVQRGEGEDASCAVKATIDVEYVVRKGIGAGSEPGA